MIDPVNLEKLGQAIQESIAADREVLERMRMEIRGLKLQTRRIHPRSATAISLVGTDGGNNQVRFDPFMIHLIRVVGSNLNQYCLAVITPNTKIEELNSRHLHPNGTGLTALGRLQSLSGP